LAGRWLTQARSGDDRVPQRGDLSDENEEPVSTQPRSPMESFFSTLKTERARSPLLLHLAELHDTVEPRYVIVHHFYLGVFLVTAF
jgi:hypothetical protein